MTSPIPGYFLHPFLFCVIEVLNKWNEKGWDKNSLVKYQNAELGKGVANYQIAIQIPCLFSKLIKFSNALVGAKGNFITVHSAARTDTQCPGFVCFIIRKAADLRDRTNIFPERIMLISSQRNCRTLCNDVALIILSYVTQLDNGMDFKAVKGNSQMRAGITILTVITPL